MAAQTRFETKKRQILGQLGVPEGEYHDLSPKGSVDEPIRPLISDINRLDGLVTTSSCSGRVSVFLEGKKKGTTSTESTEDLKDLSAPSANAGPGGKGGGSWLFISHEPVDMSKFDQDSNLMSLLNLSVPSSPMQKPSSNCSYIHVKFEPMILHILTASIDHAQRVTSASLSAGFRESGAVSLNPTKLGESNPMVAVRSAGYSFDTIVGYQNEHDENVAMVDEAYLRAMFNIANERFKTNMDRIARFRKALLEQYEPEADSCGLRSKTKSSKLSWEDPELRRQRKREEGLARQRALIAETESSQIIETP
ncbi:hypothetical protein BU24DRAFT_432159 [Aaosphaeria arxii CBS 175.79]|uniref:tRNA(Phe) 7-[(3-amino-3-carboxypropyl)-4-demethylwyosine(37)-N(4)]-methyltransferase n=1 Tax=Aaosphaeria arxii CBS 175.79 TaxID=1450172 RepID=A0A6A5XXQ7_9PLEO|nr:uncharacterized protein BU24DRAFT_432159 [Aaosphaeria arxii CBS 175.79]KAF2017430.1 hypothetical protein BU24DRAFT_432159 [Aaosphaeria arxii CBS 175.79]